MLPFLAFLAVMLTVLLTYGVWSHLFDRNNKAKKQRLQAVRNTIHSGGQFPGNAHATIQQSAFETWLRSRSGTFRRLENLVRRARSPLTAMRLMGLMLVLFTVVVMLGLLRQTNPLLLLVLSVAIAGLPVLWLSRQANQRRKAFGEKFPETLDHISRALRAGHSLTSAIGMVGKEFADPIGCEFKTVFDEINFSIPFKEAIGRLADRIQSNDLDFFVISLMIQHETGGNLTELLDGLAKTIRERIKLRGKVRTLSSEGRASTWILGSMPFLLAGILTLINPDYISVLWTTPQGHTLTLIGGGLMIVGFYLLNRIVQIKV
jgi:tight adherence protein B